VIHDAAKNAHTPAKGNNSRINVSIP
jgi:hypothetical protein